MMPHCLALSLTSHPANMRKPKQDNKLAMDCSNVGRIGHFADGA